MNGHAWGVRKVFALVLLLACGGRSEVGAQIDGGAVPFPDAAAANDYKIAFSPVKGGVGVWHSASQTVELLEQPASPLGLACTYDGRFLALQEETAFEVLDAHGVLVWKHSGGIGALRPDGRRAIVGGIHAGCVGTLDDDGTYADVRCSGSSTEAWGAVAYAPDGKTVLWGHSIYDPATTDTAVTYEIATEDFANERVVVAPSTPSVSHLVSALAFSFDGSRIGYADCRKGYGDFFCKLISLRLDTLEATTVLDSKDPTSIVPAVAFTPAGDAMVFLEGRISNQTRALRRIDLATAVVSTLADGANSAYGLEPSLCVARDVP